MECRGRIVKCKVQIAECKVWSVKYSVKCGVYPNKKVAKSCAFFVPA